MREGERMRENMREGERRREKGREGRSNRLYISAVFVEDTLPFNTYPFRNKPLFNAI
jgi:hypothetical protein